MAFCFLRPRSLLDTNSGPCLWYIYGQQSHVDKCRFNSWLDLIFCTFISFSYFPMWLNCAGVWSQFVRSLGNFIVGWGVGNGLKEGWVKNMKKGGTFIDSWLFVGGSIINDQYIIPQCAQATQTLSAVFRRQHDQRSSFQIQVHIFCTSSPMTFHQVTFL